MHVNKIYFLPYILVFLLYNFCKAETIQPKVSIITSVFNGDEYIEGFMHDITRQTIFNQSELIIVNAASPGVKEEFVIFDYMKKFSNIVYVKLAVDPGLYGVWNLGVNLSRGKYLTNANVDDRLSVDSLEQHARALDEHSDVAMVYSEFYISHVANETFEQVTSNKIYPIAEPEKNYLCKAGNHPMWRKSLHATCGLFDENYKGLGDWDMWIRFALRGAKFMKIPVLTGVWYHNPKGLSTDPDHDFIATEYKQVIEKYKTFFLNRIQKARETEATAKRKK